ncbi:MAG: peptidoglycan-binding protein, partial [Pseudomonadota bacterium]|nr:peptidoglycan-binding protein [Pseudomonadota bacterium]
PAFLVYDNFNVIMGWNRAEAYALAVGLLADRIAGAAPPSRSPVESPRLYRHQVISMQQYLNANGFDAGEADGVFGPATRAAIGRFQHANGLVADGFPTQGLLHLLGAE